MRVRVRASACARVRCVRCVFSTRPERIGGNTFRLPTEPAGVRARGLCVRRTWVFVDGARVLDASETEAR